MKRPQGDPLLTTRQVAQMCGTNEETIRYFAQTGVLRGHIVENGWEVLLSDAQPFCEAWRNEKTQRWSSGADSGPRQSPLRRAGGFGVDVINFGASVISLATTFGLDGNRAVGFALAALNLGLGALHTLWSTIRRRGLDNAIAGGAVDPDAVAWASGAGGGFPLRGLQYACLIATLGFFVAAGGPNALRSIQNQSTAAPPPQSQVAATVGTTGGTTGDRIGGTTNSCAEMPVYDPGTLVQTTEEVNMREGPSTDSAVVVILPAGTQLQVTGEFQEAGQCDWWPVTATEGGQSGFVREDSLEPAAT